MIITSRPFATCVHTFITCLYRLKYCLLACCLAGIQPGVQADERPAPEPRDPHRNAAGFFDIHVCNWPGRSLFFMALFSTTRFDEMASVEILDPDNVRIGYLDLTRYRQVDSGDGPEKRAFISQFDVPPQATDGWYQSVITLKDGSQHKARDFVILHTMEQPVAVHPPDTAENIARPTTLQWQAVPGAKYYQVFIRDQWEAGLIYESGLLSDNELVVPEGLLEDGGYYSWVIHARDTNESVLLGDFNHGSLSPGMTFSVTEN